MTEGLQASIDRDLLPEWRKAKDEAYQAGMARGKGLLERELERGEENEGLNGMIDDDYLAYVYYLGIGQAIANHGRDIVGAENLAAKANDVEGKKR